MGRKLHQNNFIFFTCALVLLLLVSAVGHAVPYDMGSHFAQATTLAALGVAYLSLNFGHLWRPFVATVFLLILLTTVLGVVTDWPEAALAYRVIGLVFFIGAAYNCSRQVLLSTERGTNVIVGALAIYLLLGMIWAALYMITLYFFPAAFKGIPPLAGVDHFPRLLYFSYVTLATLGYGDISPAMPISKTLAYLEAVVGTFYLAIVVASLIGGLRGKTRSSHS